MGRPILSPGKKLTGEKTDRYTGVLHKVQVGMCIQPNFKLICASTQPDGPPCFRPAEKSDPWLRTIERPSKTDKTMSMYMLMVAHDKGHTLPYEHTLYYSILLFVELILTSQ